MGLQGQKWLTVGGGGKCGPDQGLGWNQVTGHISDKATSRAIQIEKNVIIIVPGLGYSVTPFTHQYNFLA